jgi:two-component system, OmpR family, sensor histidine kinase TctE
MSRATESAISIRRRLLIFLLPPLVALMLAGIFVNYRAATLFVRSAYDQRLADAAVALSSRVSIADGAVHLDPAQPAPRFELTGALHYSILGPAGRLLAGNPQLPVAPSGTTNPSYTDAALGALELRVASYRLPTTAGTVTVSVAEPTASRAGPGHFILASTWLIDFIQLDVTLLLVWIGVHFGLKPLLAVRREIEARSPRELRPLEVSAVPAEVRPLVDGLNLLFDMLREAARSQRNFVADTAHQLRTPIAGLLGHLELLMRDPAAAPLRERLAALHEGMNRLAHSANQLLALARADPAGTLVESFQTLELTGLVQRVVELNVDRAAAKGIDIGADAQPAAVSAGTRLLEDLLGNLVDNAINYTPSGGHVTVRSGVTGEGKPFLEVEDDGPGIPESERAAVRQRFYRMPGSQGRGCGLGLAIVEEIARLHAAALVIDAGAGGRGARLMVLFPPTATRKRRPTEPDSAAA